MVNSEWGQKFRPVFRTSRFSDYWKYNEHSPVIHVTGLFCNENDTGNEQVGQVISNTKSAWSLFAPGSTAAILPLTWLQEGISWRVAVLPCKVAPVRIPICRNDKPLRVVGFISKWED